MTERAWKPLVGSLPDDIEFIELRGVRAASIAVAERPASGSWPDPIVYFGIWDAWRPARSGEQP